MVKVSLRYVLLLGILIILTVLHFIWNSKISFQKVNSISPVGLSLLENLGDLSPVDYLHSFNCLTSQLSNDLVAKNEIVESNVDLLVGLKYGEFRIRPLCTSNKVKFLNALYDGPYRISPTEYVYNVDQFSITKKLQDVVQCRYYVPNLADFCNYNSSIEIEHSVLSLFNIPRLENITDKMVVYHIHPESPPHGSCPSHSSFVQQMCLSRNLSHMISERSDKIQHHASTVRLNDTRKRRIARPLTNVDMSDMLIVVTTCNHIDITMKCIKSLESAFSKYELSHRPNIIIVDDRSIDGSAVLLRQMGYAVIESKIPKGVTYSWYEVACVSLV